MHELAALPEKHYFNQRTFNINDILGDFETTEDIISAGVDENNQPLYLDLKERPVTSRGYILSPDGSILNKYNFNLMFVPRDLTPEGDVPMPFRLECLNFNPH
jgi:hypothetical protein